MEAYSAIKKFQAGGVLTEEEEKKSALLSYFAYLYSKQLDPDKYGSVKKPEEWAALLQENPKDKDAIIKAANQLTDEDWASLEVQYNEAQNEGGALTQTEEKTPSFTYAAKKGAKLKKLATVKKGAVPFAKVNTKEKTLESIPKKQPGGNVHIPDPGQLKKIQKANTVGVLKDKDNKPTKAVVVAISNPKLKAGKEGIKVKKKKKCSCGCDMILTKAAGGKVVEMCSCKCGGKMKKKK